MIWRIALAIFFILCLVTLGQQPKAQFNGCSAGFCSKVVAGGSCTTSTFDKDGAAQAISSGSASTLTTPGFSTTFCNDLVIVAVVNGSGVSSVTDAQSHLTFTQRAFAAGSNGPSVWTAPLSGAALSNDAMTANAVGAQFMTVLVYAFSGYHVAAAFDTNAALPNVSAAGQCSFTTSNANDILYGNAVNNATTPDAGWTLAGNATSEAGFLFAEYQLVAATQSGVTAAAITGGSVCDAIVKGP